MLLLFHPTGVRKLDWTQVHPVSANRLKTGNESRPFSLIESDRLVQHAVEALDEGGGVFQRHAFEQESLVEEEPSGVLLPWRRSGLARSFLMIS